MTRAGGAFTEASGVEAIACARVIPYAKKVFGGAVKTDGQLFLQKYAGDIIVPKMHSGRFVELKAEQNNKWGNFFCEMWSNRSCFTVGWMLTTQAHYLWYYFIDEDELYRVEMEALRRWAFGVGAGAGRIWGYPEKPQSKYKQLNDTWGRCVPIADLAKEVPTFTGPEAIAP